MTIQKAKFKKATAGVKKKTQSTVTITLPEISPANGVMVGVQGGSRKEMLSTYRVIRKELGKRKGEKYRIIWLVKSFLVYRLK